MLSLHFEVAPVAEGLMGCSWGPCLKTPWSSVSCFRPVKGHFQDCHYQKELEKSWHLWHLTLRLWEDCVLATRSGSANREMLLYLSGWNNPQLTIYIFYFLLLTLVLNLIPLCHTAFSFLLGNILPHKLEWPCLLSYAISESGRFSSQWTPLCPCVQQIQMGPKLCLQVYGS